MLVMSIRNVIFVLVAFASLGILLAVLFRLLGLPPTASSVLTGVICGLTAAGVVPYLARKKK